MARIDRVRESYEQITERLFGDKTAFEQYLKFAGKFFKLPSEQTMTIYGTNPNAAMVADFETWKKFSRRVKRGTNSIAVLDNGSLKHYFDISQTTGSAVPYQWTLDKETANAIIDKTFEREGKRFGSFSGCVNYLGSEKARENIDSVVKLLNISDNDRAAFEKSYISMTQYLIAARCEVGGSFKYSGNVDLSALDMLHSKAEKEKLCECVQLSGKSVLLSMEKSIHEIELQRRNNYGRNQANLVRGGQDVLPRNQGGERQDVQTRPDNVRVSGAVGTRSDRRGTGVDERADRSLGTGVAEIYDGKSPRSVAVPERQTEMGADTPTDRQGGYGVSDAPAETVRSEEPTPENVRGDTAVGEYSRNDNRQGDSRGYSSSVSGISNDQLSEHKDTYITQNNKQTAEEEKSPAVSVSEGNSDLLTALKQHREIFFEDEPEPMIANAHSGRTTNIRVTFDEDLGKFILRGDFRKNVEIIENAWLSDTSTAEEMERLIKQNGYKIRGYGEPTVEKAPETHKRERSESKSADFRFVAEKTRDYLRSASEKSPIYSDILAEMNENTALAETAYAKVFAYCYEEKILPRDVPEDDLNEIISAAVEERANELRGDIPLDTLKDIDKFYVNEENESVTWAYFNPDSSAGGQLVYHTFTYDQIFDAIVQEEPLDYLEQVSKTELVDVTDLSFKKIAAEFLADNESFSTRDGNVGERLSALVEPRYGIFQLKDGENLRDYRFTDTEYMQSHGMYVDRENYNRVYRGRLQPNETLDGIFQKFNINQPEDYHGRSLSVSDVICIKQDGKTTAHFVDSYGFTEIPDFTLSREERKARHTLTDNLTLLAENQIASDEMDTLADKLFRYEQAPKYGGISGYWSIGAGMTADKFEDITTRYHNGEDVRAELAKGMFGKLDHIEFYDHSDGIGEVTISATKDEKSITFRTEGGFEVTHSWETLGNALITAARQEFDRHEELDRQLGAQEETPEITAEPVPDTADFEEIPDEMLRDYPTTPDEPDEPIQMSLFGDFEQDTTEKKIICGVDVEAALKQDLIRHGSGFEDGKFRVEQFYRDNRPDTADFAKFLSKEYGTGGHSGEGKIAWSDHDSKGISLTIKLDNGENTTMNFGWKKVANIISTLIDNQTYITQKDIDSRIKNAQYDVAHNDTDSFEYQSGVKVLEEYGLWNSSPDEQRTETAPEQAETEPKLHDIVIDLTPRPEPEQTAVEKHDFTITDEHLGEGGAKAKFTANIAAIRTLKTIESENRLATPEEQAVLAKYVGWGGLSQAFDGNNSQWSSEYKDLKELLTDEEYTAAKGSVLNAHYTSPTVINAIYKGLETLGFDGGNILEPAMGVGNFFGTMPEEMRKNSHLHGVELDSISGRIARQLYQNADIQITGFEKTEFSDNFFDAAVGNVPFGSYGVSDKRYNRENFFIHDYFLAKTLDKLAPGGVAALITTKGTMDKENPKVREYLARRGDLIGAIRLPNNAFKANAGTEVTTDILFFQKREKMAVEMPDWCYVGKNNDGVPVNNYFIDHPEMVLGTMKQGVEFSMYGNAQETACVPIEGADLKEQLENAVSTLKLTNALRKRTEQRDKEAGIIPATADVRNFTFAEVDGKMYFRENNIMTEVTETGKKLDRIKALNELRSTFREILSAQEQNCSDEQLAALQTALNTQYDRFVKQYGYVNDSANQQVFDRDDDYNSLCALEIIDEEKKTVEKSDFFTKRTVKYTAEITHVDTPQEAMQVSIDTRGKMDIPYMAALCGQEPQDVISVLKADNLIYLNPEKATENPLDGWEETSEYLSGNVRAKLRTAEIFAKDNPDYQRNVAALTSVLPPKLEAGDISARIGVSWVDVEDYQKFIEEYAKARFFGEPLRRTVTGEYKIENKNWDSSAAATQIYGTSRMNAKTIFENLLNNRDIVVRDKITDPDGREHYEINKKETDLAQDKARQMKKAFKRWLWDDPARREKYVERYNNLFNCIVGRKFDGSHQTFPGMSPSIALKPHQLDAVMRAKFGGNTLLAHCVGAGKSFEMVAATMEKKRLGLINKACVVVPKHLVGQMANEWLRLYPQAKILTATEKDFDKNHRQKFIGRCCTGDYDAVIMSYEQFEKIPMSLKYRKNFIQREIDTMQSGIEELGSDYRSRANNRSSIKDLEREKKRLETRLQKLIEGGGKTKDTSLTFEQLGFDSLVVDEAHNHKNGLVVSKMNRVSGVQTTPAQKSEDILMKTQFLNENYGEKNIIFATGTPVSNSMTELYIMQRYLRPSLLEDAGLQTFDDWASNFGEVVSKAELKPAGNGYRTKKRFAKFNNVPELMQMYKEFADIRTADMLNLPVPEIEGGKPQTIVAKPNEVQKAYMQVLAERSEAIHSGAVDPSVDNMLKITNEARLLGLDARCIVPNAENLPDSKVNLCLDKVMEVYEQTAEQKGVQAIFCDIAVNSDDGRFSVYNYIKEELVRRGVPAEEICAAGDAETQKQRNEMYAQLRSGTKRIVLASTSKMGTGANIQTKLAALHNLDIPWKPSDIEQRNGRIIRQGNEFDKVGVYNYVTENTFDAYLMNIIVTKQRFISQLMSGDTTARSCEDVDEAVLNYSEMQALASGDERIKEKIELDGDVARLRLLESEHYNAQYRLDDTIRNAEKWIGNLTANITAAKADIAFAAEHKPLEDDFKIEIGGKVYTERKAAGEALQKAAIKVMAEVGGSDRHPVGTFCGFQLAIEKIHNGFTVGTGISLRNKLTYTADMDITGDIGNITRLENLFAKGLERKLPDLEEKLSRTQTDLQEAQAAKGKPFEHAEELATKSARLEQLNRELEVGQADEVIMDDDEKQEQDAPEKNEEIGKPSAKHKR